MNLYGLLLGEAWPVAILLLAALDNRAELARWIREKLGRS